MHQRPKGRPRAFDAAGALDLAMDLFWTKGFEGVSLDELAAATGVARPSLAAAFGNKEAIYVRVMERFSARMTTLFQSAFKPGARLPNALMKFYFDAIDLYCSGEERPRGCLVFCTATSAAASRESVRAVLERLIREVDVALELVFKRACEEGQLPMTASPARLAVLAAATLQTLAIRSRAGQDRESLQDMCRGAVETILSTD